MKRKNNTPTPSAKIIEFPTERRIAAGAIQAANPFLNTPLYEGLLKHQNEAVIVAQELQAIVNAGGSGKRSPDPRNALSLSTLLQTEKRGRTLVEALHSIAERQPGPHEKWLEPFGLQILAYADDHIRIAVELDQHSNADKIFKKAGFPNWRSLVARDCSQLLIEPMFYPFFVTAKAVFYIGESDRTKTVKDQISTQYGSFLWV